MEGGENGWKEIRRETSEEPGRDTGAQRKKTAVGAQTAEPLEGALETEWKAFSDDGM